MHGGHLARAAGAPATRLLGAPPSHPSHPVPWSTRIQGDPPNHPALGGIPQMAVSGTPFSCSSRHSAAAGAAADEEAGAEAAGRRGCGGGAAAAARPRSWHWREAAAAAHRCRGRCVARTQTGKAGECRGRPSPWGCQALQQASQPGSKPRFTHRGKTGSQRQQASRRHPPASALGTLRPAQPHTPPDVPPPHLVVLPACGCAAPG